MLNTAVLVLNKHYQPIHVTTVRRAFVLLYQGAAKAVDERYQLYDFPSWSALSAHEDSIGTVRTRIRVPRVVLLQACAALPRRQVRFSRLNIYLRDGNTCQYCGRTLPREGLNLDHVKPRTQGGVTSWENIVCCCIRCNLKKGGRTPEQAGMRLLRRPHKPRWSPLIRKGLRPGILAQWRPFLSEADAAYWNTELLP
ncbi:MAG: HNH endonuclease [Deltaproteobacteria bacterium]|nr:HNH endonuclease [Deltaproteobacteria bacterium]